MLLHEIPREFGITEEQQTIILSVSYGLHQRHNTFTIFNDNVYLWEDDGYHPRPHTLGRWTSLTSETRDFWLDSGNSVKEDGIVFRMHEFAINFHAPTRPPEKWFPVDKPLEQLNV